MTQDTQRPTPPRCPDCAAIIRDGKVSHHDGCVILRAKFEVAQ